MGRRRGAWLAWFTRVATLPTDDADERLRKTVAVVATLSITLLSSVWVVTYSLLDRRTAAAIPVTYQVLSIIGLLYLARTKDFTLFRQSQIVMFLFLPFFLQWTLGGFVSGAGVSLWAFWAPVGQMMFVGVRAALPWFAGYLGLLVLSGVLDPFLPARGIPLPLWLQVGFFVLNLGVVSATVYLFLQYFVDQREHALLALDIEHRLLQDEQTRSEQLLLNILPREVAERLKRNPQAIAEDHHEVTVLFADIVDFTRASAGIPPDALVRWLNDLFSAFDRLTERRGLEKIKTIGDAYMVVGGLPAPRPDHAEAVAEMALEMQREVATRTFPDGEPVRVRIGIHSGPVVAGVIGTRKFIYDLWGDTVNTASRMESQGVAGGIQVTVPVYERLRGAYLFGEERLVEVKGKGAMKTYLLIGMKPDGAGG